MFDLPVISAGKTSGINSSLSKPTQTILIEILLKKSNFVIQRGYKKCLFMGEKVSVYKTIVLLIRLELMTHRLEISSILIRYKYST